RSRARRVRAALVRQLRLCARATGAGALGRRAAGVPAQLAAGADAAHLCLPRRGLRAGAGKLVRRRRALGAGDARHLPARGVATGLAPPLRAGEGWGGVLRDPWRLTPPGELPTLPGRACALIGEHHALPSLLASGP